MTSNKIYYTKPSITHREIELATDAVTNGWGEHCYDYITQFESLFCEHIGAKYAVATSSCTGAMHIGLSGLGISSGDEVILGDINWIASAAPITYLGATPVVVDVLPTTWCLDPIKVEAAITSRTKAIIAVHLYGNLCDIEALLLIGKRYNIPVIEDAAEAIGSQWQDKRAGSIGTFGVFSFHGTKTMTTGEGGIFVTSNEALYQDVLTLSNHGRSKIIQKQFWSENFGFKYKISNVQAAIGCAQLERIDDLIAGKRKNFTYYHEHLKHLPLTMNPEHKGTVNGYWLPSIIINADIEFDRQILLDLFAKDHIDARIFFWPLSILPMFADKPKNIISYNLYQRGVNLPSYHDLKEPEMDRVIEKIFLCLS
jgi:perosamine synthetase